MKKQITHFDRQTTIEIRKELDKALLELSDRLGIKIALGKNVNFSSQLIKGSIVATPIDSELSDIPPSIVKEYASLKASIHFLKLDESKIGAWFRDHSGNEYRLLGYNYRSRKHPFIGVTKRNEIYKLTKTTIDSAIWI